MMDRKNTTTTGVRSSAIIYSLIETAKENGLDPYRYPVWLLNIAPGLSRADEGWAESFPSECALGMRDS